MELYANYKDIGIFGHPRFSIWIFENFREYFGAGDVLFSKKLIDEKVLMKSYQESAL